MDSLNVSIPLDCSRDFLLSLMEPRRRPRLDVRHGGAMLVLGWNGTPEDREAARAEVASALAEAGSQRREVVFSDEAQP